jgi:hypothetical protein
MNGLLGLAKGFGIAGKEALDFASSGVQAVASARDKIVAAERGTTPDELRREGTSMEQAVEQARASNDQRSLPLGASNTEEKITSAVGQTVMTLAEAIATPAGDIAQVGRLGQAASGAIKMQGPAVMHGVEVGREVLKQTDGDLGAAFKAGIAAWSSMTAMGAVPGAIGAGRVAGAVTGAGIGVGMGEAQRGIENAARPDDMQMPFDPLGDTLMGVQGAVMGGVVGGHEQGALSGRRAVVEAGPQNAIERAQARAAAVTPGDILDKTVAMTQVNAHIGAVHDAAAVQGAREAAQTSMQMRRAQEMADEQAQIDQGAREQALNQAEKTKAPETTPDQGFEQAEADQAAQKDKDYTAAKNQAGDQTMEAAAGAEKGGGNEPAPTLADALPPEQVEALQKLKAQRAEELAAPPEKTVQESMREQAKGTEDDFRELPQEAQGGPETKAPPEAAPAENAAPEPSGEAEEEQPETNPPPQTPQTLAKLRQAALDTQMAEKTGVAKPVSLAELRKTNGADDLVDTKGAGGASLSSSRAQRENSFGDQKAVAQDLDRAMNPRMSHDEAKEHLSGVSSEVGKGFQIHASNDADTIPPKLKAQIAAHHAMGGGNIKGAYEDGVAHVFADSHRAGDKEGLLNTAVHELTHKGLDSFLGNDYGKVMSDIGHQIKGTKWAQDYAGKRGWNMRNPTHVSELANEYAAHMAENVAAGRAVHKGLPVTDSSPGHFQKIWDGIRGGLRKLGIVKHWNDNDIAALIRQAQAHTSGADPLRAARDGAAYKNSGGARFSLDNDDAHMEDHFPPDHPLAVTHKFGRTMEEQAKYNPGYIRSAIDTVKDLDNARPHAVLGAIGLRNIPDFVDRAKMPSVHDFVSTHDDMEGRRRQLLEPDHKQASTWSDWKAGQEDRGKSLDDIMGQSTMEGQDPSKPYVERHTAAERAADPEAATHEKYLRDVHKELKSDYDKLDDKGKQIYQDVRDNYADKRTKTLQAIEDRINSTGADDESKKNAITALRKTFESGTVKGPYFPLQRFGDLWASAKDKEGNTVAASRFESKSQRDSWLSAMREQGHDVDFGARMNEKSEMERISPEFVKNVIGHVQAADPTGNLAHDVWQEYLKAMPEMSMRKHGITRLGRLGFSGDALRAFAYNSSHGAHQLARLEYGHKMDTHMENIRNEARATEFHAATNPGDARAQSDAKWAPAIAREMEQRYDWLRNPRASTLASNLTKFGFGWYLGYAPATAFRIFSQNPMLAQPMLAKHFGEFGASKELTKASLQWAGSRGSLGDRLRGPERKAFDDANARGLFSETFTQNMMSGGSGGPISQNPLLKYGSYMFNAMEHHNRMTTHLAAYRLGVTQGLSHDAASAKAQQLTWDSHFDYTNANRPRYLQNDFMKVAGLFKQYSLGVTYRLARESADMINKEKPEDRAMARHAMASLMGRMMMFAGVTGIPGLYWAAEKAVNAWMGTDDKPYDMTAALHKSLQDHMGKTAADSIMTGPAGAVTGASLSSGASYSDLWYKSPMRTESPEDTVYDGLGQALGPLAALPINAAQGAGQMLHGNYERGLEHFLPPEAASLAKAVRYATQGATNTEGQSILPGDEQIDSKDVALQALGFSPQKVADAQRRNASISNIKQAITDRREQLSNKYETAMLAGDQRTADSIMKDIEKFNETNPGMAIGKGLARGALGMAKRNATATQGLNLPPGLSNLEQEY